MSAMDEARALLAANDGSFATLEVERRLLAALCEEVAAMRARVTTLDTPWMREANAIISDAARSIQTRDAELYALRAYHAAAEAYGPLAAQARRSAERALEAWGGNDTAEYLSAEMTSREDSEAAAKALARLDAARAALAAKGEGE